MTNVLTSIVFLGFLIYSAVVFHKYRKGELNGDAENGIAQQVPQGYAKPPQ